MPVFFSWAPKIKREPLSVPLMEKKSIQREKKEHYSIINSTISKFVRVLLTLMLGFDDIDY